MIKPDSAIYEHTLHGLGVSATEALFLDDREPNIRAARKLRIHGIQFSSIGQLRRTWKYWAFQYCRQLRNHPKNDRGKKLSFSFDSREAITNVLRSIIAAAAVFPVLVAD